MTYNKWPSPNGHAIASDKTDKMPAPADGLLPCPFCGGEAREMKETSLVKFGCDKCAVKPHSYYQVSFPDWREDAISEWNTRAQPQVAGGDDWQDITSHSQNVGEVIWGWGKAVGVRQVFWDGDRYAELNEGNWKLSPTAISKWMPYKKPNAPIFTETK